MHFDVFCPNCFLLQIDSLTKDDVDFANWFLFGSVAMATKYASQIMKKKKRGSIINCSSIAALQVYIYIVVFHVLLLKRSWAGIVFTYLRTPLEKYSELSACTCSANWCFEFLSVVMVRFAQQLRLFFIAKSCTLVMHIYEHRIPHRIDDCNIRWNVVTVTIFVSPINFESFFVNLLHLQCDWNNADTCFAATFAYL